MLKELFDAMSAQAQSAGKVAIVQPANDPRYLIVGPGGSHEFVLPAPGWRQHKASDLQAIVAFAVENSDRSAIWYSREKVVCHLDDSDRRHAVVLPLTMSTQVRTLNSWDTGRPKLSQRDLIFALRTTFAKCMGTCGGFLDCVRGIRFRNASTGDSVVKHGKASIGKQLEQEIMGTAAVPEYVTFEVPIFASGFPQLRSKVECAVEPDAATETFQIIPLPGEVENGIVFAEQRMGELIEEAVEDADPDDPRHVSIYYGVP